MILALQVGIGVTGGLISYVFGVVIGRMNERARWLRPRQTTDLDDAVEQTLGQYVPSAVQRIDATTAVMRLFAATGVDPFTPVPWPPARPVRRWGHLAAMAVGVLAFVGLALLLLLWTGPPNY